MLEFFRSKASSWATKIILGLIIFSFGFWGLSSVFQSTSKSNAVATVGDVDITKQHFLRELQQALNLVQKKTGKKISLQDLFQAGAAQQILERSINSALLAQEINRLKITTPDDIVVDVIQKDPMFSENGNFSRQKFDAILKANRLTENYYINDVRQKLAEVQLLAGISASGYVPNTLLNFFFSTAFEKRTVSIIVPKVKMDPTKLNEEEIQKFYEVSKDKFRTPEYRNFKVLILNPTDLIKHIRITDADVSAAYEQQKENFYDEDRRDILMIRVQDKQEAANIKSLIKQGKIDTLADVIPLKKATRGDLPEEEVANIAFKLPVGGVSEMVHIAAMNQNFVLYVQKIIPGGLKPFSQVKAQVLEELRQQKAMDEMAGLTHTIEDKIAANVSFAQLAKEHHLKLIEVKGVNAQGVLKNGQKAPEGINADILKTVFETPAGTESPIVEIEDAPLFIVHVDTVEPSAIPPLTKVQEQVKKLLIQKVEMEISAAKTHEIITALDAGKSLSEVAKTIPFVVHTFTIDPSDPKAVSKLDQKSLSRLFSVAEGKHITIAFEGQFALGQVVKIFPANMNAEKTRFEMVNKVLTMSTNKELIHQYMAALREKHGVKIYKESIKSLIMLGEAAVAQPVPMDIPEGL